MALVEQPERYIVGFLEFESEILFCFRGTDFSQRPVHPNHFEGFLFQVMSLFSVQGEDLVSDLLIRNQYYGHEVCLQLYERLAAMIAVRSPVSAVFGSDGDNRIDEAVKLLYNFLQALGVSTRDVSLKRCGLEFVQGEHSEYLPVVAYWFFVGADHLAAVALKLGSELSHGRRRVLIGWQICSLLAGRGQAAGPAPLPFGLTAALTYPT